MGNKIGWCDHTRNPLRIKGGKVWKHGYHCTKISPGCFNCWAEKQNIFRGTGLNYHPSANSKARWYLDLSVFDSLPKTKPCKVFVQDMSDMFHETVPDELIRQLYEKMEDMYSSGHTFLLLTKRPDRMLRICKESNEYDSVYHPQYIWPGVTVCNQKEADEKIPILMQIPAAKRFVCVEPMLEDIDFTGFKPWWGTYEDNQKDRGIDWVILGCESGPKARYCDNRWMQSVVDQCVAAGVPVWVKQIQSPGGQLIRDIKLFPPSLARREDR